MSEVAERVVGVRLAPVGTGDSRDAASRVGLESASAARAVGDLGRGAVGAVGVGAVQHHLRHVTGPHALGSQAAGGVELVGEPRAAAELAPGLATSAVALERETAGSGVQRDRPAGLVERPGGHGSGRGLASGPPPGPVVGVGVGQSATIDGLGDDAPRRVMKRRFVEETGTTPLQWLVSARLGLARELLETTDHSIDVFAHDCGLGSAANPRPHFRRALNTTPTAYRRAFTR